LILSGSGARPVEVYFARSVLGMILAQPLQIAQR
jgi:hypothetical protein